MTPDKDKAGEDKTIDAGAKSLRRFPTGFFPAGLLRKFAPKIVSDRVRFERLYFNLAE